MLAEPKSDDPRERAAQRALLQADLARTVAPLASARALPGTVFADSAIFALEQSAIFAGDWLCVGRSAELPAAGDYVVRELGGDSIIVIRGADGALHACYNACRHRGSRLLDGPAGSGLSRILCPYHSWSYGLDGRLQQAPRMGESFCAKDFSLRALRLAEHAGFMPTVPRCRSSWPTCPIWRAFACRSWSAVAASSTKWRPTGSCCARTTASATTARTRTRSWRGSASRSRGRTCGRSSVVATTAGRCGCGTALPPCR
jgi:nitrite reductase/ring-hydroxylating ferredoxin subunit